MKAINSVILSTTKLNSSNLYNHPGIGLPPLDRHTGIFLNSFAGCIQKLLLSASQSKNFELECPNRCHTKTLIPQGNVEMLAKNFSLIRILSAPATHPTSCSCGEDPPPPSLWRVGSRRTKPVEEFCPGVSVNFNSGQDAVVQFTGNLVWPQDHLLTPLSFASVLVPTQESASKIECGMRSWAWDQG